MASLVLIDTPHFKVTHSDTDQGAVLIFSGRIDEDVNFGDILAEIREMASMSGGSNQRLFFDLHKVERINSCGIREWLLFLERVQTQFAIEFLSINETFIEQANIVPGVLGKGGTRVHNMEIPYYCAACDIRIKRLVPVSVVKRADGIGEPALACDSCQGKTDLDAIPEEYFAFLQRI